MPYWVQQDKGPHVAQIEQTVAEFRAGTIPPSVAWDQMVALYLVCRGNQPGRSEIDFAESYERHARQGADSMDYMLTIWFPLYANMWASDKPFSAMKAIAEKMSRENGAVYSVNYEY